MKCVISLGNEDLPLSTRGVLELYTYELRVLASIIRIIIFQRVSYAFIL